MAQTGSGKTTMFMAPLLALLAAGRRREGQAAAAATPNAVMAVTEATKPRIVSTKRRRTDTDTPVAQCAVKPEIRSRTAPSCSPESLSSSSSSSLNTAPSGSPCPMLPGVLVLVPTRELVVQHVRVAARGADEDPGSTKPDGSSSSRSGARYCRRRQSSTNHERAHLQQNNEPECSERMQTQDEPVRQLRLRLGLHVKRVGGPSAPGQHAHLLVRIDAGVGDRD